MVMGAGAIDVQLSAAASTEQPAFVFGAGTTAAAAAEVIVGEQQQHATTHSCLSPSPNGPYWCQAGSTTSSCSSQQRPLVATKDLGCWVVGTTCGPAAWHGSRQSPDRWSAEAVWMVAGTTSVLKQPANGSGDYRR